MTSPKLNIRKSILAIATVAMLAPTTAFANDAASGLTVKSTSNAYVKMSVKAFNAGEFQSAADYSKRALKDGMSKSRRAIAYSNLCAAEAALGNDEAAAEACASALELRPGYELAEANQSALTVLFAEK